MIKKSFIITLLIVIITGLSIEWLSFQKIEQILYEFNTKGKDQSVHNSIKNYQAISCKFDWLNPVYGLVNFAHYQYPERNIDRKSLSIGFYSLERASLFSSNWKLNRIGGTTIRNTTYENLLKMVKQDCSQFQEDYKNPDPNGINWGYREAPTEEEIKQEEIREKESMIRGTRREMAEDFTQEGIDFLKNEHGYRDDFTDDELYEWVMNFRTLGVDLTPYLIPQEPTSNEDPFKDIVL